MAVKKYNPINDKVYMSQSMLEHFQRTLFEMQRTLQRRIKEATVIVTQKNDAADILDQSAIETERSMGEVNRNRDLEKLAQVKKAFSRLDKDEFGYCERCGDDIGVKRLVFNASLPLCIECAELKEKKNHEYA